MRFMGIFGISLKVLNLQVVDYNGVHVWCPNSLVSYERIGLFVSKCTRFK